jgi:hypothetical protein
LTENAAMKARLVCRSLRNDRQLQCRMTVSPRARRHRRQTATDTQVAHTHDLRRPAAHRRFQRWGGNAISRRLCIHSLMILHTKQTWGGGEFLHRLPLWLGASNCSNWLYVAPWAPWLWMCGRGGYAPSAYSIVPLLNYLHTSHSTSEAGCSRLACACSAITLKGGCGCSPRGSG